MSTVKPLCRCCGKPIGDYTRGSYCSIECQTIIQEQTACCMYCNKPLNDPIKGKLGKRYCSVECAKAKLLEDARASRDNYICIICGKEFSSHGYKTQYCSKDCLNKSTVCDLTVIKNCVVCGKPYKAKRGVPESEVCSSYCARIKSTARPCTI